MFGAPPNPAMRSRVAVELLPCRSTCNVEPMNMSQAYRLTVCENARLERIEPSAPVKNTSLRAAMYFSMPSSEPKECTDFTKPDSIAGISAGCGLSAQC